VQPQKGEKRDPKEKQTERQKVIPQKQKRESNTPWETEKEHKASMQAVTSSSKGETSGGVDAHRRQKRNNRKGKEAASYQQTSKQAGVDVHPQEERLQRIGGSWTEGGMKIEAGIRHNPSASWVNRICDVAKNRCQTPKISRFVSNTNK